MASDHNFDSILTDEIRRLVDVLPPTLKGGAPVSALLFQPTEEGGRLVYLDKDVEPDGPIHIDPGQVSEKFFFAVDEKAPWETAEAPVEQLALEEYCRKNVPEMRIRLGKQDALRYSSVQFDQDGMVSAGTRYWMHYLIPPPGYHHTMGWWKRLPRLGQIYSLGNELKDKNLLLICGMSVGIRALAIRLSILLDHENAVRESAFQIARSVASDRDVDPDDFHYMVANLLMAHHWFYAYDPVALKIFAHLGLNPDTVLKMHGWPASGYHNFGTDETLYALIERLAQDLSFLIYACTIWNAPGENKKKDSGELNEQLKVSLRTILAVICGTPRHLNVKGTSLIYQDYPADYMYIAPGKEVELDKNKSPVLPLFHRSQLLTKEKNLDRVAEAYLLTLSPIGKAAPLKKWNNMDVRVVQNERAWQKQRLGKWLTCYARARCLLKLLKEKQAAKHHAG